MKKLLSLALAALMLISCLPALATAESEYPEKLTIYAPYLYGTFAEQGATDQNVAWCWQEISRITGTEIEWIYGAAGNDTNTNLNLLIASGELPDIILYNWKSAQGGPELYEEDGIIIDLTPYMDNELANYKASLEALNTVNNVRALNGKYYYVAQTNDDPGAGVYMGLVLREDTLKALGAEIPTTLDELYALCVKAKATYGEDFYPITGSSGFGWDRGNCTNIGGLLWPFGTHYGYYQVDGKVQYGPMSEEFVEGITFIAKLYAEGLIDPDYATQDRTGGKGKIMNNQSFISFEFQPSAMMDAMKDVDPNFNVIGITNLKKDENSLPYTFDANYIRSGMQYGCTAAITTACAEPAKAAKFLDFMYTREGMLITNYGEEGVDYEIAADGSIDYTEEYYASAIPEMRNFASMSTFPYLCSREPYLKSIPETSRQAITTWAATNDVSRLLPDMNFTQEEQDQIVDMQTDIETYMQEQYAGLVNGRISIDQIPAIQDTLRSMGIEEVLEVYQTAYDRYMGK